ncbi:MAG: VWA domain-containing protein [Pyrinomonadaceae bacterium]
MKLRTNTLAPRHQCIAPIKLLLLACVLSAIAVSGTPLQSGNGGASGSLQLALPAGGEVRVENRRGGLEVEIWDENYLTVAVVEGETRPPSRRKSPVRIEKSDSALVIGVARVAAGAPATRVDLKLRVPAQARLKLTTTEGEINVSGVPSSLSAQTISGDVRLSMPVSPDASITAQSLNGTVVIGDGVDAGQNAGRTVRGKFQTRWGAGARAVNLFSGRGRVALSVLSSATNIAATEEAGQQGRPAPNVERESTAPARPSTTPRPPETPQEVDEDEVVRVDSDLVTLNVSVIDRANGRGLTGLTRENFRLSEDNDEQQITNFEAANAPFDLLLLIDLSGSTAAKRVTDLIRASALRFIVAARPQDRIAVITFAGTINVVSPLTTDRQSLRAAINRMESPNGDTKLYDALAAATEYLDKNERGTRRQAVILLSDGLDSTLPNVTGVGSTVAYDELRSRVQEFDGVLYTIWTSTEYEAFSPEDIQPETFDLAHDRMKELADAGGGVFYDVEKLEDLSGAYERVIADLGTVYSLSYLPTNKTRDGRWRAIHVRLPAYPNAVARGKRGYFAK